MNTEKFRELCAAYFLNDLDEHEANELKEVLNIGNKELIKIFTDYQRMYMRLPLSVESAIPSPGIKENIFRTIT